MNTEQEIEKQITNIEQLFAPSPELLKAQQDFQKSKYKRFLSIGGTALFSALTCLSINAMDSQHIEPMLAVSLSIAGIAATTPMLMFVLPHFLIDVDTKKRAYQRALNNDKTDKQTTKFRLSFFKF